MLYSAFKLTSCAAVNKIWPLLIIIFDCKDLQVTNVAIFHVRKIYWGQKYSPKLSQLWRRISASGQPFYYWILNRGIPWVLGWVDPSVALGIRKKDKFLVPMLTELRILCCPAHSLFTISTELSSSWFTNYLILIINNMRLKARFISAVNPSSVNYTGSSKKMDGIWNRYNLKSTWTVRVSTDWNLRTRKCK